MGLGVGCLGDRCECSFPGRLHCVSKGVGLASPRPHSVCDWRAPSGGLGLRKCYRAGSSRGGPSALPACLCCPPHDALALRCGPTGTQRGRHRHFSLPKGYVSCRSPARPVAVASPLKTPVSCSRSSRSSRSSCSPVLLAQETQLAACQGGWAAWLRPTADQGEGCV